MARLDTDNGEPWLYLLEEAVGRRDAIAIDDALFHIAAASQFDGRAFAESKLVALHAGPSPADLFVAQRLFTGVGNLRALSSLRAMSGVSNACSRAALADPNRKELCEKVATALQERSNSVMTLATGSAIGRRLGWTEERLVGAHAIMAAAPESFPSAAPLFDPARPGAWMRGALDCVAIAKVLRYVDDVATNGEVEYVRRWIERSAKTDEYLRLGRAQHARIVASEAARAAAPASAPGG